MGGLPLEAPVTMMVFDIVFALCSGGVKLDGGTRNGFARC